MKNEEFKQKQILKKQKNILKEYEKYQKQLKENIKENKEKIRKMRKTNMWLGLIVGLSTIILVTTVIVEEFMTSPNLLVIVIDVFAFFMSVNLIYQSFKTRHELRNQVQKEILDELERD